MFEKIPYYFLAIAYLYLDFVDICHKNYVGTMEKMYILSCNDILKLKWYKRYSTKLIYMLMTDKI